TERTSLNAVARRFGDRAQAGGERTMATSSAGAQSSEFTAGRALLLTYREIGQRLDYYAAAFAVFLAPAMGLWHVLDLLRIDAPAHHLLTLLLALMAAGGAAGAFTFAVITALLDRPIPLLQAIKEGGKRALVGAGVLLLHVGLVIAALLPAFILVMVALLISDVRVGGEPGLAPKSMAVIALMLLVAQSFTAPLFLMWPVAMAEGCGPVKAVLRSLDLTRAHRAEVSLLIVALTAIALAVLAAAVLLSTGGQSPLTLGGSEYHATWAAQVLRALLLAPLGLLFLVAPVVCYFLLSMEHDDRSGDRGDPAGD
ncbi:MAG: hypothetical protein AAF909_02385, partial [Pseudomonadota bacterium]